MKYRYTYSAIYRWCTYTVHYSCMKNIEKICPIYLWCFALLLCSSGATFSYSLLSASVLSQRNPWSPEGKTERDMIYTCMRIYHNAKKKNARSCSYMNLIWGHLGTRHIIYKFEYDNLTKAWQYVVRKGPWVTQTEIHDDSCRLDVGPLLKPSIIQIGSNWINRANKPASTVIY